MQCWGKTTEGLVQQRLIASVGCVRIGSPLHYITFNPGEQENTFQFPQSFYQDCYAAILKQNNFVETEYG